MFTLRKKKDQEEELGHPKNLENPEELENLEELEKPEEPEEPENPEKNEKNESLESLKRFAEARALSGEDAQALESLLGEMEAAFAGGELPDQLLETLMLAVTYGRDLEKAAAEALVRGRNEAIEERLKLLDDSDGIPHPGCQAPASASTFSSIFDIARDAR